MRHSNDFNNSTVIINKVYFHTIFGKLCCNSDSAMQYWLLSYF